MRTFIAAPRRLLLSMLVSVLALAAMPTGASSQSYPNRPIRVIVPIGAGGLTDIVARTVAERLEKRLGQPIVIENKPGADTVLGTTFVARADPDGYTLLMADSAAYSIAPQLHAVEYDTRRDFTLIGRMYDGAGIIVSAHPSAPFRTVPELVAYAKANPGKLDFATGSAVLQITGEMFKQEAGVDIKHVPYRGSVQAVSDTLAGHVGMVVTGTASAAPHIQAGKLVPIAVASPARSKAVPTAPTFIESGYPGVIMANWFGLLGPKGLPQPVVDRINAALSEIIGDPALKDLADQSDLNLRLTTGEPLRQELADEYRRIGSAIEKAAMKVK